MATPMIVVLAAGLGSRYGGIKQMAPVGASGEWLLDFSLWDAWQAGFRKVLFIIRPELEDNFKETIGMRLAPYFEVDYVGQSFDVSLVPNVDLTTRVKPLGTGHALLCAKDKIQSPFVVINADDYYGPEAYKQLYKSLMNFKEDSEAAMVAFPLKDTLSEHGTVARGICKKDSESRLISIMEKTGLIRSSGVIMDEDGIAIDSDTPVSMNIWGLQPSIIKLLEKSFESFKDSTLTKRPLTAEFYLPTCLSEGLQEKTISIEVLSSNDQWIGMTYQADRDAAALKLQQLQHKGVYPLQLWSLSSGFESILNAYSEIRQIEKVEPITRGHINATYKVLAKTEQGYANFVLQQINTHVFKNPVGLMANIEAVTKHMTALGARTLELLRTKSNDVYMVDKEGAYWRLYKYIENSVVPSDQASLAELHAAGEAFGAFQYALSDFPAQSLTAVIPNFHHTPERLQQLKHAIQENPCGRVKLAGESVDFALGLAHELDRIVSQLEDGTLPLRVTHNDTKVNNVLLTDSDKTGLCVIDLDTVMPGSLLYDYGDGIRSSVTGVAEDEENLSVIQVDLNRFEAFTAGFLKGLRGIQTPAEADQLLWGAVLMSYECGIRFLTDYLLGDVYFSISREAHNLIRAKSQFKLVKELMAHQRELEKIIKNCLSIGGATE